MRTIELTDPELLKTYHQDYSIKGIYPFFDEDKATMFLSVDFEHIDTEYISRIQDLLPASCSNINLNEVSINKYVDESYIRARVTFDNPEFEEIVTYVYADTGEPVEDMV